MREKQLPPDDPGNVVQGPWADRPGPSVPRPDRPGPESIGPPAAPAGLAGVEEFDLHPPDDLRLEHCYRHPDRETGVSCSNCGRPICWECMTPAPVGFRCPECMGQSRAQNRSAPVYTRGQIRSRWQGGLGVSSVAPATMALIGLNVLMFILQSFTDVVTQQTALVPYFVAVEGEYWRLATAMFVHASLWHLAFNMFALYIGGRYVEEMLGTVRFLIVYLVSGLGGSVLVMVAAGPTVTTVGASGAIYGLFGALVALFLHRRDAMAAAALRNIGFLIVINLAFTFLARGISWQAHIGGLITGFLVVELLQWFGRRDPRAKPSAVQIAGLLGFVALLTALVVWRVQTFPVIF